MSAKKNWLIGCGVGCGLLLLALIAIPVVGALFMRGTMEGFDAAIEGREALEARYGATDTFTPWPAGPVPPERIEAFLRVRNASQPARTGLAEGFVSLLAGAARAEEIEEKGFVEKLRFGLGMARTGVGLAPRIGEFFDSRNRALLDAEMGLGEYTYLYAVSYYGLLEHSPSDGPADVAADIEELERSGVDLDSSMNNALRRVRRDLRTMLRSQLTALPSEGGDAAWRAALSGEVEALEAQRSRLPWQDGVPHALQASFAPYLERLETTYNPATNPFELARNKKQGRFSFSTD